MNHVFLAIFALKHSMFQKCNHATVCDIPIQSTSKKASTLLSNRDYLAVKKNHLWRFEGVVGGKVDGEEEDTPLVGAVWRPHDGGLKQQNTIW